MRWIWGDSYRKASARSGVCVWRGVGWGWWSGLDFLEKEVLDHRKTAECACVLGHFSCVRLFATLWTVARQDPLSIGFSRQEYWSRFPFPPSGDLPKPGTKPAPLSFLHWQAGSLPLAPQAGASVELQDAEFGWCRHRIGEKAEAGPCKAYVSC